MLSKPILPIEVKYQLKNDNEASGCDDEDDDGRGEEDNDGHDDPFNWNPEKVLQHAQSMFNIKKKIQETARKNISEQQKKDKLYYDKKHFDLKVHELYHTLSLLNLY